MTGVSDGTLHRLYKKSAHRRKDSGELDVFDATMYFYGGTETSLDNGGGGTNTATLPRNTIREELKEVRGGRRVSLDMHMSMVKNTNAAQLPNPTLENSHRVSSKQNKEKKYKQPMSPGGRLASFLNSLFNQNSSRNKKKAQSMKDYPNDRQEETSVEGMRRSSVSHFGSLWTSDSKSLHSSSSSGFRTPPHAKNATNAHNTDVRRNSDYKQVSPLDRKVTKNGIAMGSSKDDLLEIEKRKNMDLAWLEENMKLIDGLSEKNNKRNSTISPCNGLFKKDKIWIDDENDCGDGESDSSSDLFELQNYDVGLYSNGLPVYETTNIDSIKRGPPITNGHDPNF